MRHPKERAVTLRTFAGQIERYAAYFDVRARAERASEALRQAEAATRKRDTAASRRRVAEARAERMAADAADASARDDFQREPGAHALFQRFEFEAELFEALEAFKARVAAAERARAHKPAVVSDCSPTFALLQDVIGAAARK